MLSEKKNLTFTSFISKNHGLLISRIAVTMNTMKIMTQNKLLKLKKQQIYSLTNSMIDDLNKLQIDFNLQFFSVIKNCNFSYNRYFFQSICFAFQII